MTSNASTALRDQYDALQSGRGFVELKNWMSVAVTGADRQSFLHNFCTNDIKRLAPGDSCEAFFTNVKGRIVGHGLVTCRENELVVIGEPEQAAKLVEHLDRYILREDVQLHDRSAARAYLLIGGWRNSSPPTFEVPAYTTNWYKANGGSFLLIETATSDSQNLRQNLTANGLVACEDAFDAVRIEAGIPLLGVDFDDRNFPQEVGRNEQAISFTKGCYLGQETVARIDAIGHVNQQLAGVRLSGPTPPDGGTEFTHAGKTAGRVTSATFSLKLQAPLAVAMLRREHCAVGTQLDSPAGPCQVIALPL